jgi:hypothetical protein
MRNEKVNNLTFGGFTFSFLILHFSFLIFYAW